MRTAARFQGAALLALLLGVAAAGPISCGRPEACPHGAVRPRPPLLSKLLSLKGKRVVLTVQGESTATLGRIASIDEEAGVLTFNLAPPDEAKPYLWYIALEAITIVREMAE